MANNKVQIIIDALNLAQDDLRRLQKDLKGVGPAAKEGSKGLDLLKKVAATVGLAKLGQEALQFSKDSIMLSARVETLGVVTETLGRNAGYTAEEIHSLEQSVADQGITMRKSRESIALMLQSQMDLTHATELARMAQDTAVISNKNSSEAFRDLVHIIQTGSVVMARNAGLAISFSDAYDKWAEANGRTTESLTEQEKIMIRTNAVLEAGVTVQGTYEAAMESAGKKISSYARHFENLQVAFGDAFQDELNETIDSLTKLTDGFTEFLKSINIIDNALDDHAKEVVKTSNTYEDFAKEMIRSWTVAGKISNKQGKYLIKMLEEGRLSADEFESAVSSDVDALTTFSKASEMFTDEAIRMLETMWEQRELYELLSDSTNDYANLQEYLLRANINTAAEFDHLADMMGITNDELKEMLGIVPNVTYGMEDLEKETDNATIAIRSQRDLWKSYVDEATGVSGTLKEILIWLERIQNIGRIDIPISIGMSGEGLMLASKLFGPGGYTVGGGGSSGGSSSGGSGGGAYGGGFIGLDGHATGADFIIPPGFANDTYPIGYGTSGERVIVQTKEQQQSTSAGVVNIYNQTEGAAIMAMELVREMMGNQMDEAMI